MKKLLLLLFSIALCSCTKTSTTVTTDIIPTDSLGTDSVVVTKTITTTETDPVSNVVDGTNALSWFLIALGIFNSCTTQ